MTAEGGRGSVNYLPSWERLLERRVLTTARGRVREVEMRAGKGSQAGSSNGEKRREERPALVTISKRGRIEHDGGGRR